MDNQDLVSTDPDFDASTTFSPSTNMGDPTPIPQPGNFKKIVHTSMEASSSSIVAASSDSENIRSQETMDRMVMNLEKETSTDQEPFVGQEFDSLDDVYFFYNSYALQNGFGIRKASSSKSSASKSLIWKRYECDKAGFKKTSSNDIQPRINTKVGCLAKIDVRRNKEEKWVITSFVKEHNHTLDTPRSALRHRSHNITHKYPIVKELMNQLHQSGMGPSRIAKILNSSVASSSVSTQNVIDQLRGERKNNVGQEGVLVAQYLHGQNVLDKDFYYAMEFSEEGVLRSIFWVDSRARADFSIFGDVIVFDVTYRTNAFCMPFAPFTGVNHHRQSILFGCALLADETEDSFIWLFEHWLECMYGKAPSVIITDMDIAIYNAIKKVFPNTRHRFCSWHINKHLIEHIHGMRDPNSEFSKDYQKWFYSKYISMSEHRWKELVEKYHIDDKSWLANMWERRNHWVPAFLKDVFVSGMTASSRSESINAFFDGFVTSKTRLIEFVKQYERALVARRQAEFAEDFKTMNTTACLQSQVPLEASVANKYTRIMFKLFQIELKSSLNCWHDKICKIDNVTTYRVGLPREEKDDWCTVVYDQSNGVDATCDCSLFETAGYLCKHILCIMGKKRIMEIPAKYVLHRWTIYARNVSKDEGTTVSMSDINITPLMKWNLITLATKVAELSSKDLETYMDFKSSLEIRKSSLESKNAATIMVSQIGSNVSSDQLPQFTIRDPVAIKNKGRPKVSSRVLSGLEASQTIVKKRTCGFCGDKGHYTTTCPHKDKGKNHD